MKKNLKQSEKRRAFTIVELLTVMSIIVVLFGLLVPAMNVVRKHAKDVKQAAQFHSINAALELYSNEFNGYPDSAGYSDVNSTSNNYPGAMKLAEAMVGQDLLGFHPSSVFNRNGTDNAGNELYPQHTFANPLVPTVAELDNIRSRKGPYLPVEGANAYTLKDLYGAGNFSTLGKTAAFDPNGFGGLVVCDEYPRVKNATTGKRIGMPILYYKADVSKTLHSKNQYAMSIYDFRDNIDLINLPLQWDSTHYHPMAEVSGGKTPDGIDVDGITIFYDNTKDKNISSVDRPVRSDTYILISAGWDGLYGTKDDMFNFNN